MGKVSPALYNNNFMQDDYLSRLNRYSSVPPHSDPPNRYYLSKSASSSLGINGLLTLIRSSTRTQPSTQRR